MRLATWYRLERAGTRPPLEARIAANRDKVHRIAAAQAAGTLPATFAAADLLALVVAVAAMWSGQTQEDHAVRRRSSRAHRRAVVVAAVEALLATEPASAPLDRTPANG